MLENDLLKPIFLQIDLENMILAAKNIRIVSLVSLTSEIRTGPDLRRHGAGDKINRTSSNTILLPPFMTDNRAERPKPKF